MKPVGKKYCGCFLITWSQQLTFLSPSVLLCKVETTVFQEEEPQVQKPQGESTPGLSWDEQGGQPSCRGTSEEESIGRHSQEGDGREGGGVGTVLLFL